MSFSIDIREKDGLRTLHFGSDRIQGAMRIGQPFELALEYTRVMMVCLLLRKDGCEAAGHPPAVSIPHPLQRVADCLPLASSSRGLRDASDFPRNVLLVGLGAGSQAKFLYRHCPSAHLTVVEIEPRVVEAAREHFELPDDPARLEIVVGDGFDYAQRCNKTFDLILVDGFNEHAHPGDLNTRTFYEACRARLGDRGLLAVNLIGLSHSYKGGFAHVEAAFGDRAVLFPKCKSGNTIAFAAAGEAVDITLDELKERARALEARTALALLPVVGKLDHDPACRKGRLAF